MVRILRVLLALFAAMQACPAHAADAHSSGAAVALDDGSLVVAAGSSVCHKYSVGEKLLPLFVGLGYGYGGDTYDSAALGLSSITADGRPNPHFGRNGVVVTPLPPANNHDAAVATALLRDPRGRLIVVGWRSQSIWPDAGIHLISAARYIPSGALDTTFGDRGVVNLRMNRDAVTEPSAAVLDAQGRLLVAGYDGGRKVRSKLGSFDEWTNHLFVARFTADGRLDSSFGSGGFAVADVTPAPPKELVNPKCRQDYRTCVWLHQQVLMGTEREFLVYSHSPAALVVDAKNRIVAGASASDGTYILARFLPDGGADTTFGSGGTRRTSMPAGSSIAQLLVDGAGHLIAAGSAGDRIVLVRYTADGALDTIHETPFAKGLTPSAALLTADGHLFVAASGEHTIAVGLFDSDGAPSKSFGQNGIMTAEVSPLRGPAGLLVSATGEPTVAAASTNGVAVLHGKRTR